MEPAAAAVAGPGGFRNSAAPFLDAVDENSTHAVAHLAQDPSGLPRYDRGPLPESLGDDEPEAPPIDFCTMTGRTAHSGDLVPTDRALWRCTRQAPDSVFAGERGP